MDLKELNHQFIKLQFGSKTRMRLYRKLISFLRNGVPLPKALRIMWMHASDDGNKPTNTAAIVIMDWMRKVGNGMSFGRAIRGWVPETDRIVIEAGEAAGRLDIAIENAMFIGTGTRKIKSTIFGGLAYPALIVSATLVFLVVFAVMVIPAFEEILPRDRWVGAAAQMAMLADFVNYWLLPIGIGFISSLVTIVWSMPRWTGTTRSKFDRYPPWSLYRLNAGAGFLLAVSALVKAGVQIPEILRILQRGASPWYYERVSSALRHVSNGINLGEALYKTGHDFPDRETVRDLRSFAELEGFDETLEQLGRQWLEESIERIQSQISILKNASFIFLGLALGFIANGLFALNQQVASSL